MAKLFALEDDGKTVDTEANDLLIDKVLKLADKNKDPVSLTADVIKQRQELKKDIQERLNAEPEEGSGDDSSNDDNSSQDDNPDGEEKKEGEGENGEGQSSDDSSSNSDSNGKDKENLSAQADDKDSLKSVIGSGLSNDSDESKGDDKPAQESFKPRLSLARVFSPLKDSYNKYLVSMESFNVPGKLAIEEQPIVYVKDSVLEALNNLVGIANNYIGKNKTFIDSNAESIKNVNERLTVLRQFVENRKYHFTHTLVNDQKLLSEVSVLNRSDLRETSKYLLTYIDNSNRFVNYVLNNDFNSIGSALANANFMKEDDDFAYKAMLPGFNIIRAHVDEYQNYLKANIENFHYYQLKTFKTEHLYNLDAIGITEDKELDFVMTNLDKMLIDLSLSVDNFNVVNSNLNKLIDEVKIFIYDVENDKYANLAELDIDSKVKDFIKFKMVSEAYYSNVGMLLNYILTVDTIINKCIELKS